MARAETAQEGRAAKAGKLHKMQPTEYNQGMIFEWDLAKNESNSAKHGIDFANAPLCFESPMLTWEDVRFDYPERRWISIAKLGDVLVVLVYANLGGDYCRIISLRRANRRERKIYWDTYPGE